MEESAFIAGIFLVEAVAAFTILPRVVKFRSAVKVFGRNICEQCGLVATKSADPLTEQKIWNLFHASLSDFFRYMMMVIFGILLLRCFSYQLRWLASPEIPERHRVEDTPTLVMLCFTLLYLNFGCFSSPCLLNVLSGVLMAFTVTLSSNYSRSMASRLLIGITTRDFGFVVLYNLICTGVDVHTAFMTSEDGEKGATAAIFSEASYQIVLVLAGAFAIRTQIWARAQRGVRLKNSELELAALYRILGGLCDAVVMLDDSLRLTEDSAALSTLFLRGCSSADLAGNDFVSCFRSQDRDHVRQRLSSATIYAGQPALALNVGLQDSAGNCINVELLHLPFQRTEGCIRHVVGIREFHQDVAAAGPLIMADLPSSTLGSTEVAQSDEERAGNLDCDVIFDVTSLAVFFVSDRLRQHSEELWHNTGDLGTLHDFPGSGGQQSLVAQVQLAINQVGRQPSPRIHFQNLHLLGFEVESLRLEYDTFLGSLVGCLHLAVEAASQAWSFPIAGGRQRSRSASRGSSPSTPSRQDESLPRSKTGSIRSLRGGHVAL